MIRFPVTARIICITVCVCVRRSACSRVVRVQLKVKACANACVVFVASASVCVCARCSRGGVRACGRVLSHHRAPIVQTQYNIELAVGQFSRARPSAMCGHPRVFSERWCNLTMGSHHITARSPLDTHTLTHDTICWPELLFCARTASNTASHLVG